jgi:hypothetical protein
VDLDCNTDYEILTEREGGSIIGSISLFSLSGVASGDVILANLTSYVQLLYLAFRFSPSFVTLKRTGDKAGEVGRVRGLFGAIIDLISEVDPGLVHAEQVLTTGIYKFVDISPFTQIFAIVCHFLVLLPTQGPETLDPL